MNKRGLILILGLIFIISFFSLTSGELTSEQEDEKVNLAYSCLNETVFNLNCSNVFLRITRTTGFFVFFAIFTNSFIC